MEIKSPDIDIIKSTVSQNPLIAYVLHLADNSLVMGHRLSEWTGHGPVLEQDIAISNIALDHIGQARNFYQYAAELIGNNTTEDHLAYFRDAEDFRNSIITELPNGDWGNTIMKLFLFSTYQQELYSVINGSSDKQIAAIAVKSSKEVQYHVRWSSEWVIRLGDGTEESKKRMDNAVKNLWPYITELFSEADFETSLAEQGITKSSAQFYESWIAKVAAVFKEATLDIPPLTEIKLAGKEGIHSEHLLPMLSEMQVLQRTYPGCEW